MTMGWSAVHSLFSILRLWKTTDYCTLVHSLCFFHKKRPAKKPAKFEPYFLFNLSISSDQHLCLQRPEVSEAHQHR